MGRMAGDRRALLLLVVAAVLIAARSWLSEHPQHNPWAPLDLNDPVGLATEAKLTSLRGDVQACRAVLERSEVMFSALEPAGQAACARPDRTRLDAYPLTPAPPATTCDVAIALELWQRNSLKPVAQDIFGQGVAQIQHLGAYSCRRLYGRESGAWSEHATANAIDIAGFVLTDGTRISVLGDWDEDGRKERFLKQVRDGACNSFSTVLSPDYNAAHADHLHLDMSNRWSELCR